MCKCKKHRKTNFGTAGVKDVHIGSNIWETPFIPKAAVKVAGVKKPEISLNDPSGSGAWRFLYEIPDYTMEGGVPAPEASVQDYDFTAWNDKNWQNIKVPGEPAMQGFDISTNQEYYYQREITIPQDFTGNRILVRFDGVYCNARVWINGTYIRTHIGGFTTWDCDITEYALPGHTVTMTVGVADLFSSEKGIWNPEGKSVNNPANATQYAHHNIGGINRDVSLLALPFDCIMRTYVETEFDESFIDAELHITAQLAMVSQAASLYIELLDGERREADATLEIENIGTMSAAKRITIPVAAPKKWDAEHPNLYTLRETLLINGKEIQVNEERIGFREIHYGGRDGSDVNKIYVNGKEVKLRGTCRHDVSVESGRSVTREECYAEIRAYKNANINHIRTSHYPGSEDLLDACDELGMYVEQETAVCFQGPWENLKVRSQYKDFLPQFTEMIERDRNRPSILIWSLGNESNYARVAEQSGGNAFEDEKTYLKDVEPSRPCIFSFPETGEPEGFTDIYSIHYVNVTGDTGRKDRPVLHEEYAHIPCYNLDELQRDVNVRNFWGESVKKAWENVFMTDGALGGDLWGGIDDVFYLPEGITHIWQSHSPGQATGYGEWGSVLDAYFREKPEAWLTKKAYSPIRVDEASCHVTDGTLYIPVKNWFDHTNLNEIVLRYTYGDTEKQIQIKESVAPHTEGIFTISGISGDTKEVNLKFFTADGIMADEYNVTLSDIEYPFTEAIDTPPVIQDTTEEIFISGTGFSIAFSKKTGLVSRGTCGEEKTVLLTGGPYLHVTGMVPGEWVPEESNGISAVTEGKYAVVTLNGAYTGGQGVRFILHISGNGIITTEYTLTTKPKRASGLSEVGISYDIPAGAESVSWLRNGIYSAYPEDHIGRNKGTALKIRENAGQIPDQYGVKPAWPWKDDMKNYFVYSSKDPNNGLATNDFKTMRENIYCYDVNYGENAPHIQVESKDAAVAARVHVAYDTGRIDPRDPRIQYFGDWQTLEEGVDYLGEEMHSTKTGDWCELTFTGTGVSYIGARQKNVGNVKVYIDGEFKEEIDTYSDLGNELKQSVIYCVDGLKPGEHKIRLEATGGNSERIIIDSFRVVDTEDENRTESARLIIDNQWYYPNLGWGNYRGIPGEMSEGMTDSVTMLLTDK